MTFVYVNVHIFGPGRQWAGEWAESPHVTQDALDAYAIARAARAINETREEA